jgi:hypothetical protein
MFREMKESVALVCNYLALENKDRHPFPPPCCLLGCLKEISQVAGFRRAVFFRFFLFVSGRRGHAINPARGSSPVMVSLR